MTKSHEAASEPTPPDEAQQLPPPLGQPPHSELFNNLKLVNRFAEDVDLPSLLAIDVDFDVDHGLVVNARVDSEEGVFGVAVGEVCSEASSDNKGAESGRSGTKKIRRALYASVQEAEGRKSKAWKRRTGGIATYSLTNDPRPPRRDRAFGSEYESGGRTC